MKKRKGDTPDWERLRRLRWGAVRRLIMLRWKTEVPNDEAGRPDLFALMTLASLAPSGADEKMRNVLGELAPWMGAKEAEAYIDHLSNAPISDRCLSSRQLGVRLHLSNADRERWGGLNPILPFDMTDEELAKQRRVKRNKRRRLKCGRSRAEFLATSLSRLKPWEAERISRRTWERRRVASAVPSILSKVVPGLASPTKLRVSKGIHGDVRADKPHLVTTKERVMDRKVSSLRGQGPDLRQEGQPNVPALSEEPISLQQLDRFEKIRARFDALPRPRIEAAA